MSVRPAQSLGLKENPVCLKTQREIACYFGDRIDSVTFYKKKSQCKAINSLRDVRKSFVHSDMFMFPDSNCFILGDCLILTVVPRSEMTYPRDRTQEVWV